MEAGITGRDGWSGQGSSHLHVLSLDGAYYEGGAELVWNELGHLQTREVGGKRGGYRAIDKPRRPSFRWVGDNAGRA